MKSPIKHTIPLDEPLHEKIKEIRDRQTVKPTIPRLILDIVKKYADGALVELVLTDSEFNKLNALAIEENRSVENLVNTILKNNLKKIAC